MTTDHRKPMVQLATLWERESKAGNTYFSGFLNGAQLLLFRGEEITRDNGDVVQTWNLLLQERDQAPRREQPTTRSDLPVRGRSTWNATRHATRTKAAAAGQAILDQAKRQAEPSDGRPFDDEIPW